MLTPSNLIYLDNVLSQSHRCDSLLMNLNRVNAILSPVLMEREISIFSVESVSLRDYFFLLVQH